MLPLSSEDDIMQISCRYHAGFTQHQTRYCSKYHVVWRRFSADPVSVPGQIWLSPRLRVWPFLEHAQVLHLLRPRVATVSALVQVSVWGVAFTVHVSCLLVNKFFKVPPQNIRLRLSVFVRCRAGYGEKFQVVHLWTFSNGKK